MGRFLTHLFTVAVALAATSWVVPGVDVTSLPALLVAALVLGFVNAIIRPIMVLLTLPVTVLTLGLFYFVVNGVAFALAAFFVPGFTVESLGWAIVGALVLSVASWFVGAFTNDPVRRG